MGSSSAYAFVLRVVWGMVNALPSFLCPGGPHLLLCFWGHATKCVSIVYENSLILFQNLLGSDFSNLLFEKLFRHEAGRKGDQIAAIRRIRGKKRQAMRGCSTRRQGR